MLGVSLHIFSRPPRVLNIDGGGVKGLISGVMFEFLESKLQELDGEDARLVDYFDVVTATSTGGLIATMITAPDNNSHPFYAAKETNPFYLEHCPQIFPQKNNEGFLSVMANLMDGWKVMNGPKYDGKYLRSLLRGFLKEKKLHEAIIPVIIPGFDIKCLQPVIFSTYEFDSIVLEGPPHPLLRHHRDLMTQPKDAVQCCLQGWSASRDITVECENYENALCGMPDR